MPYFTFLSIGGRFFWPIFILWASFSLALLFAALKPFRKGIIDIVSYCHERNLEGTLLDLVISIILSIIIFFPPLAFGGSDFWAVTVLELLILFCFFIFILKLIKNGAVAYSRSILNVFFLFYISYLIFQIALKTTKLPYYTLSELKLIFLYFMLFTVIINYVRTREEIDGFLFKIVIAGLFVSVVAIAQLITGADRIYWIRKPYSSVFFGPFEYWNHFACYVSMAAFLALGSLCANIMIGRHRLMALSPRQIGAEMIKNLKNKKTLFLLISFAVMALALFLSESRAGIILFLAVFIFFISFLLHRNYSKRIIIILIIGTFAAYVVLDFLGIWDQIGLDKILDELSTLFSSENYTSRTALYTIVGPKIFTDFPFFGTGLGVLYYIIPTYLTQVPVHGWGLTEGVLKVAVIHRYIFNDIFQLLLEAGLAGFLLLSIPFLLFLFKFFRKIMSTTSSYKFFVGMGILSSLLFLGLHVMIDFDMALSSISSLFIVLLALCLPVINLNPVKNYSSIEEKVLIRLRSKKSKLFFSAVAVIIFIYLFFIASRGLIANILVNEKRPTVSSFKRAIALEPKNDRLYSEYYEFILARYKKGYITRREAYSEGGKIIDKAIELNPYRTAYITSKADLELLMKNYKKASLLYKEAALLEPNNPIIQMGYAVVIFWDAIHQTDKDKKGRLLKKGMIYYSKARALSGAEINISSIVRDNVARSFLIKKLNREGIDIK